MLETIGPFLSLIAVVIVAIIILASTRDYFVKKANLKKAFTDCTTVKQHYVFGMGDTLKHCTEMSVWIDPKTIAEKYEISDTAAISLCEKLPPDFIENDLLFVESGNITILRAPMNCQVSFGTNCFDATQLSFELYSDLSMRNASILGKKKLAPNSQCLRTIKRI